MPSASHGPLVNEETHEFYDRYTNTWLCAKGHMLCIVASVDGKPRYCRGFSGWPGGLLLLPSYWALLRLIAEEAFEDLPEKCGLDPLEVVWSGRGLRPENVRVVADSLTLPW